MLRYNLYLLNHQYRELGKLPGSRAEHIRHAIEDYLIKLQKQQTTATSPSKIGKEQNDNASV